MSSDPAPTATAPTQRRAPLGDRIGSALCVLVALLVIERSLAYGLSGTSQVVGAGAFPFGLGLALLGLGAVWAWQSWHGLVPPPSEEIELPDRGGLFRIAFTSAVLLGSALLFETLDFRLTLFLAPALVMRVVFGEGWHRSLLTGLGIAVVSHLVLVTALDIPLPMLRF